MATNCVHTAGYSGVSIDIQDHKRYGCLRGAGTAFDILSRSGFPFLGVSVPMCRGSIIA